MRLPLHLCPTSLFSLIFKPFISMKKLILLLIALPLLFVNCGKESQPEGPTTITTTYKGLFITGTIDATSIQTPALVVVTENSSTDWSMSLEVDGQTPQVLATSKNGTNIQFTNQTYHSQSVEGKGSIVDNGAGLRFTVQVNGSTTDDGVIGKFTGEKQ